MSDRKFLREKIPERHFRPEDTATRVTYELLFLHKTQLETILQRKWELLNVFFNNAIVKEYPDHVLLYTWNLCNS